MSLYEGDSGQYILKNKDKMRHRILWIALLCLAAFVVWAYFATLDEATVAEGRVIPSAQRQVIQNLEGGIVETIDVKEGQRVKQGQQLIVLDDTKFQTELNEIDIEIKGLGLQLIRLAAEADNKPFSVTPDQEKEYTKKLIDRQEQLYDSRQREMENMEQQKEYAEQELKMSEPLLKRGAVSDAEILHLRQRISELQKQIDTFRSETLHQYRQVNIDLEKAQQRKVNISDKIKRAVIRSPINGIVAQIFLNTLGSVVKPGEDIMEIVPQGNNLIIEARVKPADIGFIHIGQEAIVKISAYDFTIYGGLDGEVTHISADSTTDEEGEHYFEVWVKTDQNHFKTVGSGRELRIIPGMMASVDIITGRKSVLTYLFKPILRAKGQALRER